MALDASDELAAIPMYYRRQVVDAIRTRLMTEPARVSRNRKPLLNLAVPWLPERTVWELRVGQYRVFYDVDDLDQVVYVRAIRLKASGRRTEDIL